MLQVSVVLESEPAGRARRAAKAVRWPARARTLLAAACLLLGAGCASVNGDALADEDIAARTDPLEIVNRQIFAANLAVDTFILRPAAVAYREIVPDFGKTVIRNVINHLRLPLVLINDLAQGETRRAETTFSRFLVNTAIGLGGLFDPATSLGLAYHNEDAGQTFGSYGIDSGPYLVLPLLGPSNFRDTIGLIVDWLVDPVRIGANAADVEDYLLVRSGADAIDSRYRNMDAIDRLRERSLDFYATIRSLYRQRRVNEILNGSPHGETLAPDLTVRAPAPMPVHVRRQEPAPDTDPARVIEVAAAPDGGGEPPPDLDVSLHGEAIRAHEAAMRSYEEALRAGQTATRTGVQ